MISLQNIYKTYNNTSQEVHALVDINLEINEGDYVSIIGSSGSGKSTLMNILGALDNPSSGEYLFNTTNINYYSDDELAELRNHEIGFVFQAYNLISYLSAIENVMLPLKYANKKKKFSISKAQEVLDLVGLQDRYDHLPNELSGGQQQRVAIARALVNSPSLILADEPTGNLDSISTSEILNLLDSLNKQGNTIVIITHEDEVAERAKTIIKLQDGRIVHNVSKA